MSSHKEHKIESPREPPGAPLCSSVLTTAAYTYLAASGNNTRDNYCIGKNDIRGQTYVSCARFKTFARTFQVSLKITPRMVSVDGDAACRAAVLSRGKATQIVQSPAPAVGELRPYSGTPAPWR
jgi:hypothetical protein